MSDCSGSDSDDLIWDFGKPNIPEDLKDEIEEMKKHKRKKRNSKLWPSPHAMKVALDNSKKGKPETPPQVQNEPLEGIRSQIKLFRHRLDMIAQEHTTVETGDDIISKNLKHSDNNSPPCKKLKARCDASILNDSIDEDSLALCSQLVEDRFINRHVSCTKLAHRRGSSYASNEVAITRVIEKGHGDEFQPTVTQPSKAPNLLDDDDDLFLNESLLAY